jgi:hypothetical protein
MGRACDGRDEPIPIRNAVENPFMVVRVPRPATSISKARSAFLIYGININWMPRKGHATRTPKGICVFQHIAAHIEEH